MKCDLDLGANVKVIHLKWLEITDNLGLCTKLVDSQSNSYEDTVLPVISKKPDLDLEIKGSRCSFSIGVTTSAIYIYS